MITFFASKQVSEYINKNTKIGQVEQVPLQIPNVDFTPCTQATGNNNLDHDNSNWVWSIEMFHVTDKSYFIFFSLKSNFCLILKAAKNETTQTLYNKFEANLKRSFKKIALQNKMLPELIEECFDNFDYLAGPYGFYQHQEPITQIKLEVLLKRIADQSPSTQADLERLTQDWVQQNHPEHKLPIQNIYYLYWLNSFLSDSDYEEFLEPEFQYENIYNVANVISFQDFKRLVQEKPF